MLRRRQTDTASTTNEEDFRDVNLRMCKLELINKLMQKLHCAIEVKEIDVNSNDATQVEESLR